METRRFRDHGWGGIMKSIRAILILILIMGGFLFPALHAQVQADTIVEVQVSVEQPVKDGDSAGATEAARAAAFKRAIEQALPPGTSEEEKKNRMNLSLIHI